MVQIPPPEGPKIFVPAVFVAMTFGVSAMVYVFHMTLPVAASIAERLPRNVQHSYFGSDDDISSQEAAGT